MTAPPPSYDPSGNANYASPGIANYVQAQAPQSYTPESIYIDPEANRIAVQIMGIMNCYAYANPELPIFSITSLAADQTDPSEELRHGAGWMLGVRLN